MNDPLYREAKKRVNKKKAFYSHLASYIAVGLFFFLMNMATSPGDLWFFFPLLPWGIGLAIHYFAVFGLPGTDILTEDWEHREIEKEAGEIRARTRQYRSYPKLEEPKPDEEGLDLRELEKEKSKQKRWDERDLV